MRKTRKKARKLAHPPVVISSSRGAVENAIDVSKDNKAGTWEEARKRTGKIATWDDLARNSKVARASGA